jgi:uncharacterized membrane protein YphA (DoxX/SURF4 family)
MKLPHSLRLVIFLLRLVLGLNFFYLGFTNLFSHPLEQTFGQRSLTDLYAWIAASTNAGYLGTLFAWMFLIIGVCLLIGLLTRLMSTIGFILILASYFPGITSSALTASQFVSDGVIVAICLLVLIFSNAGAYLGVDKFIHIGLSPKPKK